MKKDRCEKIVVYIYRMREDSPRASTGSKLLRLGLARKYNIMARRRKTVLLDPTSQTLLSKEDLGDKGLALLAVDRSWNRLLEEGDMPASIKRGALRRRLPLLIASNPINFGKGYKLSTAEAIASSFYLLGCPSRAEAILGVFKWGPQFKILNEKFLVEYSKHRTRKELEYTENMVKKYIMSGA
jgi:pre-rRNA-processing protein TSR3